MSQDAAEVPDIHGTCDVAANGEEAVEAVRLSWKEQEPYDLVCLDLMMPGIGGMEVLREMRKLEKERAPLGMSTKVIITTVKADPACVDEALSLQVSGYLLKPVSWVKLMEMVQSLGLLS